MGNDGGSIPTRRELVRNAARALNTAELKEKLLEAQTHAWITCPLSNKPLVAPIVSDCTGTLYNKDSIIEFLLPTDAETDKKEKEEVLQGKVKALKDVVEVKFMTVKEGRDEKMVCPITSKELGPLTKSVYLVPCGHVFSEVAIKEVKGDVCVECNEPYTEQSIITILPVAKEDIERLVARADKLKGEGLSHSLKKAGGSKKRKKGEGKEFTEESTKEKKTATGTGTGIKNAATASLTAKVLSEQEERNKRRKMAQNGNLNSLFSNKGYDAQKQKGGDFMTRGFSLPKKT